MNTTYEEIVDVASIGSSTNPINLNELLTKASKENLTPAVKHNEKVLLIGIDEQQDFMDNGSLGVPGAHKDIERFTKWIYNNLDKIYQIAVSIDTHNPFQIFNPSWWIDENGNNPDPYTSITLKDLDDGKWKPVIMPKRSREYVEHLEKDAKKTLMIWTYHCINGTQGHSLENQFSNMIYFHSVAKKSIVHTITKGVEMATEFYGIIKPEWTPNNTINIDFLNKIETFDKVVIGGEAKSHCVLESIKQILEHFSSHPEITSKITILEDCMSVIPGFEDSTASAFDEFKTKYKVNIVKSTEFSL